MKINKALIKLVSEYAVAHAKMVDAKQSYNFSPTMQNYLRISDSYDEVEICLKTLVDLLDDNQEIVDCLVLLKGCVDETLSAYIAKASADKR